MREGFDLAVSVQTLVFIVLHARAHRIVGQEVERERAALPSD